VLRYAGTLVVTGLAAWYLVSKIDLHRTGHELANARLGYLLASLGLMVVTVWPMAWRWQQLLRAQGVEDRLSWLVRAYFVSYMVGQVLPTSIGGDASRIYETTRRHPGNGGAVAASVLLGDDPPPRNGYRAGVEMRWLRGESLRLGAALAPLAALVRPLKRDPRSLTAWHIYPVRIDFPAARLSRPDLMRALGAEGIGEGNGEPADG